MASGLFLCLIMGLFFGRNPLFKQRPVFALTRSAAGGLPVPQTPWDVLSTAAPGQGTVTGGSSRPATSPGRCAQGWDVTPVHSALLFNP